MKSLAEYIIEQQNKNSWGKVAFIVAYEDKNGINVREEHSPSMVASNFASFRKDNEFLIYCIKTKDFKKSVEKLAKLTNNWKNEKLDNLNNSKEFEDILEKEFGKESFNKALVTPKTKDELEKAAEELADKLI